MDERSRQTWEICWAPLSPNNSGKQGELFSELPDVKNEQVLVSDFVRHEMAFEGGGKYFSREVAAAPVLVPLS